MNLEAGNFFVIEIWLYKCCVMEDDHHKSIFFIVIAIFITLFQLLGNVIFLKKIIRTDKEPECFFHRRIKR